MLKRNAAFLAPLAIATAALPAIWIGSASAAGTLSGGIVHLYQVDDNTSGHTGQVTITGALADYGLDNEGTTDTASSELNTLAFPDGTFEVDLTNFGSGPTQLHVNDANCSYEMVTTGRVPIVPGKGTGIYTGIRGTFGVTATFAGVLPPLTGANGPCDTSQVGATPRGLDIIEATGNISFSG